MKNPESMLARGSSDQDWAENQGAADKNQF
jgi:hypothetical protein